MRMKKIHAKKQKERNQKQKPKPKNKTQTTIRNSTQRKITTMCQTLCVCVCVTGTVSRWCLMASPNISTILLWLNWRCCFIVNFCEFQFCCSFHRWHSFIHSFMHSVVSKNETNHNEPKSWIKMAWEFIVELHKPGAGFYLRLLNYSRFVCLTNILFFAKTTIEMNGHIKRRWHTLRCKITIA